jgi:hypothetical protein
MMRSLLFASAILGSLVVLIPDAEAGRRGGLHYRHAQTRSQTSQFSGIAYQRAQPQMVQPVVYQAPVANQGYVVSSPLPVRGQVYSTYSTPVPVVGTPVQGQTYQSSRILPIGRR